MQNNKYFTIIFRFFMLGVISQQVGIIDQLLLGVSIVRRKLNPQLSLFSTMERNQI